MRAGFWEILLIVVLVLVLFGHSKIPDLAKNIANGINVFKKELKSDESKAESKKQQAKNGNKSPKPKATIAAKKSAKKK